MLLERSVAVKHPKHVWGLEHSASWQSRSGDDSDWEEGKSLLTGFSESIWLSHGPKIQVWSRHTLLYILQWRYTRTPDKLLLGKKTEPWDTETYFLGIHMSSVRRKKKRAGIQYSKQNPFLKKVSMAFHCHGGRGVGGRGENPWFLMLCVVWPHHIDLSFLGFLQCSDTALQLNWARLFWASLPSYRLFFLPHTFLLPRWGRSLRLASLLAFPGLEVEGDTAGIPWFRGCRRGDGLGGAVTPSCPQG